LLELSSQASWTFRTSGGKLLVPYAELGVRYEFERPNDGQILTGDLKFATPSPWSGLLAWAARPYLALDVRRGERRLPELLAAGPG